eukprot:1597908-Alexandrium_andersonii.AAC.1
MWEAARGRKEAGGSCRRPQKESEIQEFVGGCWRLHDAARGSWRSQVGRALRVHSKGTTVL